MRLWVLVFVALVLSGFNFIFCLMLAHVVLFSKQKNAKWKKIIDKQLSAIATITVQTQSTLERLQK